MKIVSKKEAMRIKAANPKATVGKFDNGKYKWTGSEKDWIGKEVQDITCVKIHAVFVERRSDKMWGPYAVLRCCHERINP